MLQFVPMVSLKTHILLFGIVLIDPTDRINQFITCSVYLLFLISLGCGGTVYCSPHIFFKHQAHTARYQSVAAAPNHFYQSHYQCWHL